MTKRETERQEAAARLREWVKPGDTIHTILRHRARSGMFRRISLVAVAPEGRDFLSLDYHAARALGLTLHRDKEGLPASGCGMDMGFHLVYELSHVLFPKGYGCIGERCPSNDHSNGDRDRTVHGPTDEHGQPEDREPGPGEAQDGLVRHWHRDGGYALRHRWL